VTMRVAVLGAGYVGLALCRRLTDAHDVVGVRRSNLDAVRATGARAVRADITDPDALDAVPEVDALVFVASSGGRGAEAARRVYVEGLKTVIASFRERANPPERLVYTSSTGVYGDHGGDWVDETTPVEPTTEKTRVLLDAERVATGVPMDTTVVRFAGLYGPGRYRLERYLEGPVTAGYLNMLHRDDAAGVLAFVLRERSRTDLLLAVDDDPVEKHAFADWLADACGVARPAKRSKAERLAAGELSPAARRRLLTSKRCSNARLRGLGYEFAYPTYRTGYRAAVEAYRTG